MYYRLGTYTNSGCLKMCIVESSICSSSFINPFMCVEVVTTVWCMLHTCIYTYTACTYNGYFISLRSICKCFFLPSYATCIYRSTSTSKSIKERRAFSTESIQQTKQKYSPVLALRDAVRAEREAMSQSVEVSILSEKAAAILGIAPPKHYKRASMYDPLHERRSGDTDTPTVHSLPPRSNSYHPGLRRGKAIDRGVVSYTHVADKTKIL